MDVAHLLRADIRGDDLQLFQYYQRIGKVATRTQEIDEAWGVGFEGTHLEEHGLAEQTLADLARDALQRDPGFTKVPVAGLQTQSGFRAAFISQYVE